jgi:AcrR family transcriptional regulator
MVLIMTTPTRTRRTAGSSARWRRAAPVQQRSRDTLDRFAEAAETLLRDRPFEDITVQDIVRLADRPIGSFYARFASKEALMPHIYQRYHDGLAPLLAARLARVDWSRLEFRETCAGLVELFMLLFVERRWLLRAVALFARQHPEALPPGLKQQRQELFEQAGTLLMRHRAHIAHADPARAIRFGLYFVAAVARDKLLFSDAPHASATPMSRAALRDALVHALASYLACEAAR